MKKHYSITATVKVVRPDGEEKLFPVSVIIPVALLPGASDSNEFRNLLSMMVVRHFIHYLTFESSDFKDIAVGLIEGDASGFSATVPNLEYKIVREYNQWLPLAMPTDIGDTDLLTMDEIEREAVVCQFATSLKGSNKFSGAVEVLEQLAAGSHNPVWDGDITSKSGRDVLLDFGLAVRVAHCETDGYTAATYLGRDVFKKLYGNAQTLGEAIANYRAERDARHAAKSS